MESYKNRYRSTVQVRVKEKEKMLITVYNSEHGKEMREVIKKHIEKYEGVIVEDFNIRTEEIGGEGEKDWDIMRKSRDKTIGKNNREKKICGNNAEKRLSVLNGKTKGDWEREYTSVSARRCILINYAFVNENILDKVIGLEFKINERMDLNHLPITIDIQNKQEEEEKKRI